MVNTLIEPATFVTIGNLLDQPSLGKGREDDRAGCPAPIWHGSWPSSAMVRCKAGHLQHKKVVIVIPVSLLESSTLGVSKPEQLAGTRRQLWMRFASFDQRECGALSAAAKTATDRTDWPDHETERPPILPNGYN